MARRREIAPRRRGFSPSTLCGAMQIVRSRPAVILVALVACLSAVIPWTPARSRIYTGFDKNLLFVSPRDSASGRVSVGHSRAVLAAPGGSNPAIHLVDSENDFTVTFDARPQGAEPQWRQVAVRTTAPKMSKFMTILVGATKGAVSFGQLQVAAGAGASNLGDGTIFSEGFAEAKLPGWVLSNGASRIRADSPSGFSLRLAGGAGEAGAYSQNLTPVKDPSVPYTVSATVRYESGSPLFKVAIAWFDQNHELLGYAPDWGDWAPFETPLIPLRVSLWYPAVNDRINLAFVSNGAPQVVADITDPQGRSTQAHTLGAYTPGVTYGISVDWHVGRGAVLALTDSSGSVARYVVQRNQARSLFDQPFVNLTVDAAAPQGSGSSAEISNYRLAIPSATRLAVNIDDGRSGLVIALVVAWLILYLVGALPRGIAWARKISARNRSGVGRRRMPFTSRRTLLACIALASLLALYGVASLIDGHPFDRLSQETAIYITHSYGLGALYGRSTTVPDAAIRGGTVPWAPAEFAYPPGITYFYQAVGTAWQLTGRPGTPLADRSFYIFWKLGFALFILVSAVFLLLIARRIAPRPSWFPWLLAILFAVNPAVVFDAPVWGQSNSLLTAFLLLAVLGVVVGQSKLVWIALIMALLMKQTALFAFPIVAIFAVRLFGLKRTVTDLAFGAIVGFVFVSPFILSGYHPATVYLSIFGKVIDFGTPLTHYATQVTADTFPVWVMFAAALGVHGHDIMWASDQTRLGGSGLSYSTAGLILFTATVSGTCVLSWRGVRRAAEPYKVLCLAMAVVIVGYVSLNTRTSGHYLTLAIPFLLLGLPKARRLKAAWKTGAVTLISLISMYGLFMFIANHGEWPNFAVLGSPSSNAVSQTVYSVYTSDIFIGLLACLLLFIVVKLLIDLFEAANTQPQLQLKTTEVLERKTATASS